MPLPLHPFTICCLSAPWPQYTLESKQVLQLQRDNLTAIPDGMHI